MQPDDSAGPRPLHFQMRIDFFPQPLQRWWADDGVVSSMCFLNRVRDLAAEASKSNQQLTKIGENASEMTFYSLFFNYFFVTARLKSNGNKTHCFSSRKNTNLTLI